MSKKAKAKAKEIRLQKKRAIKAANKAKYLSWRISGENSKSFRSRKKAQKNNKKEKGLHTAFYNCGNLACPLCFKETRTLGIYYRRNPKIISR